MLEKLASDHFKPYLNQTFHIYLNDEEQMDVQLITVTDLGAAPQDETRRAFSLIFRGPREFSLPQRIYPITHPQMGALELFLVPIGPDAKGMQYQALFN